MTGRKGNADGTLTLRSMTVQLEETVTGWICTCCLTFVRGGQVTEARRYLIGRGQNGPAARRNAEQLLMAFLETEMRSTAQAGGAS